MLLDDLSFTRNDDPSILALIPLCASASLRLCVEAFSCLVAESQFFFFFFFC